MGNIWISTVVILIMASITFFLVMLGLAIYLIKILDEIESRSWLTLEALVSMGYKEILCKATVVALYQENLLEIKQKADLSQNMLEEIRSHGFDTNTVKHHEFKLKTGGGRRRKKVIPKLIWKPAFA